jgi:REase_MTES_1575
MRQKWRIYGLSNTTIQIEGRTLRPDLFVWIPSRPSFKVVVECDGFAYHSDKAAFSRDRGRDRILQQQGYQVFRFSGQEIFGDPIGTSHKFINYLFSLLPNGEDIQVAHTEHEPASRQKKPMGNKKKHAHKSAERHRKHNRRR